jgi:hypothetical protein
MRPEPRRSYLSALTFSKPRQRRSEPASAASRLSTKDAAKGAATFLAGAAGAAMSVKSSLDMNATISKNSGPFFDGIDQLKLTPTQIASRAFVAGARSCEIREIAFPRDSHSARRL